MRQLPCCPRPSTLRRWLAAPCLLGLVALPGTAAAQKSLQPAGWDANLKLAEVADTNPDPKVVEVNIEAKLAKVELEPGKVVEAWTYNGSIPGPTIRANVGDRLIIHFTNNLPEATTIHSHGIRLPIAMDGVPGYSQSEVEKGGTFTYDYVVPDAGLFWYHPHVNAAAQVGNGLYGPLLVKDPAENVGATDELLIVLSDIGLDEHDHLDDPNSGGTTGMAFGREGNIVLVNGRKASTITARAGVPQRWRILNPSKSRYFALDLDGQDFKLIGTDGGLQEYPTTVSSLVIGAAERVDVIVTPQGKPGGELPFRSYVFNRGFGSVEFRPAEEALFIIKFTDEAPYTAPAPPPIKRDIKPLSVVDATKVQMDLTIEQLQDGSFQYGINKVAFNHSKPFLAKEGETQIWTLTNKTPWTHPFHLHGFFFQVLDEKTGQPERPLAWKDTVSVPFEKTVKIVVKFDEGHPGKWMMHCHILDHAEGGLMGAVQVGTPPPDKPTTTDHAPQHKH